MSLSSHSRFLCFLVSFAFATTVVAQRVDYSQFCHQSHVGQRKLECASCHRFPSRNWKEVRKGDEAFPDITEYPEHKDCLSCHRSQFFARERPVPRICKSCHVNATPSDTSRLPFPSLGEKFWSTTKGSSFVSDFLIHFPHGKHSDQECSTCHAAEQGAAPKNASDLFQLKSETFKNRLLTHTVCFTCHNQESELAPLPQSCDSCHKLP